VANEVFFLKSASASGQYTLMYPCTLWTCVFAFVHMCTFRKLASNGSDGEKKDGDDMDVDDIAEEDEADIHEVIAGRVELFCAFLQCDATAKQDIGCGSSFSFTVNRWVEDGHHSFDSVHTYGIPVTVALNRPNALSFACCINRVIS